MGIRYYPELIQGSDEWVEARCGLLTASEMKLIITPSTMKAANNDKARAHLYELLAQRITGYVEPQYVNDDMLRGQEGEIEARTLYARHYSPVREMGFITNDKWGFTLGYSPDGLVGDSGVIEIKSPRQKSQAQTIANHVSAGTIPEEYQMQVHTGMLVSERTWCDFISYSGGMPMAVIRVHRNAAIQEAILKAASDFEDKLARKRLDFDAAVEGAKLIPTERRVEQEIVV